MSGQVTDVDRWNALKGGMVVSNNGERARIPRVYDSLRKIVRGQTCTVIELLDEFRQNVGFVGDRPEDQTFTVLVVFERHGAVLCDVPQSDLANVYDIPGFVGRNGTVIYFTSSPDMVLPFQPDGSQWMFIEGDDAPISFVVGRFRLSTEFDANTSPPMLANVKYPSYRPGFRSLIPAEIVFPAVLIEGESTSVWGSKPWFASEQFDKMFPSQRIRFSVVRIFNGFSVSDMMDWNETTRFDETPKSKAIGGIQCTPSTEPIRMVINLPERSEVLVSMTGEAVSGIQMLFESGSGQFFIMRDDNMPQQISMLEYAATRAALERAGCFLFEPGYVVRNDLAGVLRSFSNGKLLLGQIALNIIKKAY